MRQNPGVSLWILAAKNGNKNVRAPGVTSWRVSKVVSFKYKFLPQSLMLCWNLRFFVTHQRKFNEHHLYCTPLYIEVVCGRCLQIIKAKGNEQRVQNNTKHGLLLRCHLLVLLTDCLNDTCLIFHPGHGTCFPTTPPANHPYLGHQLWPRCVLLMSQAIVAREKSDSFKGCFHETTSQH